MAEKHLASVLAAPAERAFWWPRFQRLARWFIATETARRGAGTKLLASEIKGAVTIGSADRRSARRPHRRDRAGRLGDHRLQDRPRALAQGAARACSRRSFCSKRRSPLHGRFEKIDGPARAVHLSYWQANGLGDGGAVKEIEDSEALVPAMIALLHKMIEHFGNPATPYTAAALARVHARTSTTTTHLERVAEWSTAGGEE